MTLCQKTYTIVMIIMKKVIFAVVIVSVVLLLLKRASTKDGAAKPTVLPSPTLTSTKFKNYTANFEIYTNSTKRIFTDQKYHNRSEDVYISLPDPSVVNIEKPLITWTNFFETLPMKLTKECLTTGTGQTFCNNDSRKLKFLINNIEEPEALDKVIEAGSTLVVRFE